MDLQDWISVHPALGESTFSTFSRPWDFKPYMLHNFPTSYTELEQPNRAYFFQVRKQCNLSHRCFPSSKFSFHIMPLKFHNSKWTTEQNNNKKLRNYQNNIKTAMINHCSGLDSRIQTSGFFKMSQNHHIHMVCVLS